MPWKSDRQRRWGNSPAGMKAMGQKSVDEFNKASEGKKMPSEVIPSNKPMMIKETIKNHPSIPGMKIYHTHRGSKSTMPAGM